MAKKLVNIEGMKCDGCANTVKEAFSALDGVKKVEVNLEHKQATIKGDVSEDALKAALKDTHYSVTSVEAF